MSTYEDYERTSNAYDLTRIAIGAEILAGAFALGPEPIGAQVILDAGCGTGSYSHVIAPLVRRVHAIDRSAGMLAVAAKKLGERVSLREGDLEELPFKDHTFDGVMLNQVLHHVVDPAKVIAELARVLRPGGVLVVNTCTREQVADGYWTSALVPEATARLADRYLALDALEAAMVAAGLTTRGRVVPVDAVVGGPAYFDAKGPLRAEWRAGDSLWALATSDELEAAMTKVRALDAAGELAAFLTRADAKRLSVGQVTFVLSRKNA